VIIEVQNGDYPGEDDIVRFDDIYGQQDADLTLRMAAEVKLPILVNVM
jgi:hypothetical protein